MKLLNNTQRGVTLVSLLIVFSLIAISGIVIEQSMLTAPASPPAKDNLSNLVRGYIAVAVGKSFKAEVGGIFDQEIEAKDIHLPGVTVFLEDPATGKRSDAVRTDLGGRFTLFAPEVRRYKICWKSDVYGDGCTSDIFSAGGAPQFLSTVNIRIPQRRDMVALFGHVTSADGTLPRTFDPLLNINAFATVGVDGEKAGKVATVYVNNSGDYLVPYVPIKQKLKLTAAIEAAAFTQEIWPEAQIERRRLHRLHFKIDNHRPQIDPLAAFDSATNKRVQNATPGSQVDIKANARDKDGDPIKFAWFLESNEGQLSTNTGSSVQWKLPTKEGRYTVTVVAFDGKGGYDKAVLSVLTGAKGIPFTGIVVEPSGIPVKQANVEIVGNPVIQTDNNGHFAVTVTESDRYVVNVRKEGYALNSQIFDRAVTGGRWILRRGQIITIIPGQTTTISHRRGENDCPGPDSVKARPNVARDSINIPQWQDGKGNVIDPPDWWEGPRTTKLVSANNRRLGRIQRINRQRLGERQPIIIPKNLRLPPCGPGVSVTIPANSILDASGNPAAAPLQATIATVDLVSPQQMPGDDSVVSGPTGGTLESFGAGSLDLPTGFKLRPGATAKITIPVDRSRRMGGTLPPTVPLLTYDESRGVWIEEGTLTLMTVAGVQSYVGDTKHFSAFNADNVFTNASCVRVFSPSLPGNYDLEVAAPLGGTGAPKILKKPIVNSSPFEHVIYNLPNNVNITLAPMTQGANPNLLGFYVVNTGPPQNPSNSPNVPPGPPYTSCQNFVVMKIGSAPDSPFGGEFLHGLGFIAAANLGFDDLTSAGPTGIALRDAIVAASRNYYDSVDPTDERETFDEFKTKNGFSLDPNTPVAGEIVAQYANSGDLGFGRDMHCLEQPSGDVACYVTNYGNGYSNIFPGGGTPDQDDANAAGQRATVGASAEVATVAMEFSPIEKDAVGDRVVKFYVYKKNFPKVGDYGRSISANLDGRGERPVPQLCMICHGGQIPVHSGGVPSFGTAAQVKLNSRFIAFDHRFFTFPTNPPGLTKADQEDEIKLLNEDIVNATAPAPVTDPIREIVTGMYNGGVSTTQIREFTVPQWVNGASAAAPNQEAFYRDVVADGCRTCHASQPFDQLTFNTSAKFLDLTAAGGANRLMLGTAQLRVCGDYVMPHALRTHDIFWDLFWDVPNWGPPPLPLSTTLQNFGDGVPLGGTGTWKTGLCTSFISGTVTSPSQFYQQSIQPIWNGKCVGCHILGGIAPFSLTQGDSFPALVPGRVVAGNDNPAAPGNTLLSRITAASPAARMPPNCFRAPEPPVGLPCLSQIDIDKIKAWIRSGAN